MGSDSEEDRWIRQWRRQLLALMLGITFAGGALFGLVAGSLQVPAIWWGPMVLVATGAFWLAIGPRR